jgi:serine/threonine protein kinase
MNCRASSHQFEDRFKIIRQLARTAHSIVDLAFDHDTEQLVVIKWLAPTSRGVSLRKAARAFLHEIMMTKVIAALSPDSDKKRYFPQFITMGKIAGKPPRYFFVESYLDGETLDSILAAGRPADALKIARNLCHVLRILHVNGIIHGDLHPRNIIVKNDGNVSLIDFGLSRYRGEVVPELANIGRPCYTPPEQLTGGSIDERSDFFALAQVLDDLLAVETLPSNLQRLINLMREPLVARRQVNLASLQAELAELQRSIELQQLQPRFLKVLLVVSIVIILVFYLAFLYR